MIVRLEGVADHAAAIEVERAAFGGPDEPRIVEAVRDLVGSFAFVAEDDGEIVGHVQMSRAWVGETEVLALGPIGVIPDRQRRGIGSALLRAALAEAARRGEVAAILLGDPAYYGRFGFQPAAVHGLANPFADVRGDGFRVDDGDFQIVVIGHGARLEGEVRWHPAFG